MSRCIVCRHVEALRDTPPPERRTDLVLVIGATLGVVLLSDTPGGHILRERLCANHARDLSHAVDAFGDEYLTEAKEATS